MKLAIITTIILFNTQFLLAQNNSNHTDNDFWWIKTSSDTLPSINLAGVYDYIDKKNLKARKKVIVSVLDTDLDINHQAFDNLIWTNKDEIPNNKIDDDRNGYVDDKNGWNFIGKKSDGKSLSFTLMEETRILRKYSQQEFDKLYKKNRVLFDYDSVKNSYDEIVKYLNQKIEPYSKIEPDYTEIINVLKESFNKEVISFEDLENFQTSDDYLKQCIAYVKHYYDTGYPYNEFMEYLDYKQKSLDVCMNLDYDNRELVGDNQYVFKDNAYGSSDVSSRAFKNHGTEVTGIISQGLNLFTKANILSMKIMPVVITGTGDPTDKDTALAIRYAVDNGAKVINLSQGKAFSINDKVVDKALKYAEKHDVLIVQSAGNQTLNLDNNTRYPNDTDKNQKQIVDNVIIVGASTNNVNELMRYSSNYGKHNVDLFAPSTNIATLLPNNEYLVDNGGTSYATPVVASIATLIRAYFPELSASQVKHILMDSGTSYDVNVTITKEDETEITKPFSSLSKSGKIVNAYNAFLMAEQLSKSN